MGKKVAKTENKEVRGGTGLHPHNWLKLKNSYGFTSFQFQFLSTRLHVRWKTEMPIFLSESQ